MKDHSELSAIFNADEQRVNWHDETLWWIRQKRDKAVNTLPEWELLRENASQIKQHTLSNLSAYLEQFEAKALANGVKVHWAANAAEHNEIVLSILKGNGINRMVKSKSMLTEECHLNTFLENNGIEVIDSDLGERIVQLAKESPSHIVLPCIHKKKEEIGELFHEHLDTPAGEADPQVLTEAARQDLRNVFLTRRAALTGVNFAVAETGEIMICTNEGNADMGAHLADIHLASMGIEKIIPQRRHLGIFLRLLARSATGQPITTYSSHFRTPRLGQQMHIILVDNGRSQQLGRDHFRNALKCIRCGACMNTCPVYRKSGGHSYQYTISGPIGSILAPNLDMKKHADLPFASTLCGSCTNVCPVKIDIHNQLYQWRQELVGAGYVDAKKKWAMKAMSFLFAHPSLFAWVGKVGRRLMMIGPYLFNNKLNPWYHQREMPRAAKQSFREWYKQRAKNNG